MTDTPQELWQRGQRFTGQQRWDRAATAYKALLEHSPGFVPAWLELSTAQEALDQYRDARTSVLRAAAASGPAVPAMLGMTIVRRLRRFEENERFQAYIEATQLHARVPAEKLVDLAMFVSSIGAYDKTARWIDAALRANPNLVEAHNLLGLLHMFGGKPEQAAAAFERTLALRPSFGPAYSVLSRVTKVSREHNHVDQLRKLLSEPGLARKDEVHYAYALHNELHDLGDFDEAWNALQRACKARKSLQPYDHAATLRMFAKQRELFTTGSMEGASIDDPLVPIFIIGMHRSGTTLLERILAGHGDIADAGETYTFTVQMRLAADHFCDGTADLELIERSGASDFQTIGRGFLDAMRWRAKGKRFITEKLNPNFILAGQIAKALPQARLLHMQRDAADTCFSNLRTLFTTEAAYSYDQIEVADYYKAYSDLMQHWREVQPGRIFDIRYEDLVGHSESEATRVAAHCGLEFKPEMLDLGRDSGMVATASSNQVRQGILKDRGRAWQPYAKHVAPMLDRLAKHGLA